MKWWINMAAAFAAAVSAAGCSGAELGTGDENVGNAKAAIQGPICDGVTKIHQCWGPVSQGQSLTFDSQSGMEWFIRILTPTDVWPIGQFWSAGYADTQWRPVGGLMLPGKSVATHVAFGIGTVFALSTENNVVYYSTGTPAAAHSQSPDGTNYAHWNAFIWPYDKEGTSLCLSKIVSMYLPTQFGQGRLLLALSCSGSLYVQDWLGSEKRWMPASQHPGFVGLPSLVWRDISHDRAGGATLLSESTRDLYRAAVGGIINSSGTVSWNQVTKLPQIFNNNGRHLLPTQVGGRYVITNAGNGTCTSGVACDGDDDRFYRFDPSINRWIRHTGGTWSVPQPDDNIAPGPYYTAIVDTGKGFMVRHAFSWMIPWTE